MSTEINKDITILIPSYQPKEDLVQLVDCLNREFAHIVVVDDGSSTEFRSIFEAISRIGEHVEVVTHAANQGKGRALKTGFNHVATSGSSGCAGVITVDGDGQHRMEDVKKVAETMRNTPDAVVLGCRSFHDKNIPFRSRFGNQVSKAIYKWACGLAISDTQTGLRGIPANLLTFCCQIVGEKYDYETNMLLAFKDAGVTFQEVSIQTIYENGNESSHFHPVKDSIRIYAVIVKYSISSLVTSLVDYIAYTILLLCGAPILVSTYGARLIAGIFNFSVNRQVVFKNKGNVFAQLIKYALLVFASGTVSGFAITWLSNCFPQVSPLAFKIPVEVLLYLVNYYVQRTFVFKRGAKDHETDSH